MAEKDSTHSTLREHIVEHVFVGEALRTLWCRDITDVEMLRSEFDAHGYDLLLCRGAIVRHIQFKTQKAGDISVSLSLAERPSGCVVWVGIDENLNFKSFHWLGGLPGQPLPDIRGLKVTRRQTHNKKGTRPDRRNHRKVPKREFERLATMEDVLTKLFGELTPMKVASVSLEITLLQHAKWGYHETSAHVAFSSKSTRRREGVSLPVLDGDEAQDLLAS